MAYLAPFLSPGIPGRGMTGWGQGRALVVQLHAVMALRYAPALPESPQRLARGQGCWKMESVSGLIWLTGWILPTPALGDVGTLVSVRAALRQL